MKKLLCILLALLLLSGCAAKPIETEPPETTAPVTEPPIPWIDEAGSAWDREGVLRELTLTVLGGTHYTNATEFNGDLLLWSIDNHLQNVYTLELCLFDLDSGTVIAGTEQNFAEFVSPQILGDTLFLCDAASGKILALSSELKILNQWEVNPAEANFIMGGNEILYIHDWKGSVTRVDLNTLESAPLLPDVFMDSFDVQGDYVSVCSLHPDTGEIQRMYMDLRTGLFLEPPVPGNYTDIFYRDGIWLCVSWRDFATVYAGTSREDFLRAEIGGAALQIVNSDTLLLTSEDGCNLSLHDLSGQCLSKVVLTESPYSYTCLAIIPSQAFGGYFMIITDHSGSLRLLFWDMTRSRLGENIPFVPIPEPAEAEAAVRIRAEELSIRYGLNILVGTDCNTDFYDFTAEPVTDWELVAHGLDTLEAALEDYPEDFFRQLRYGDVRRTEIHLVGSISATNSEYVDTYEAFVQENYDCHVMVADITQADVSTYYHEFSHIIDSYLEWDAMEREGALFSEETWCSLNPRWFDGYSYDYSWQQDVEDYTAFVGTYATINPTEDRAMVLEYAMVDFGRWTFENAQVLTEKLDYYCRCIRDAFDTSGWPDTVLWEQYLP